MMAANLAEALESAMPRTITLAAALPATPERLYNMYLDPAEHSAFTGAPVTIAAQPGAEFQAFNGALSGTILHVESKRLIVQKWRSVNFPDGAIDSVLVLSFWPEGKGARIELVHVNVPEEDFAGVSEGWVKFYWNPWRAYLAGKNAG
jgi:activator of HSP90 ATPase